jgi:hypothetical protein
MYNLVVYQVVKKLQDTRQLIFYINSDKSRMRRLSLDQAREYHGYPIEFSSDVFACLARCPCNLSRLAVLIHLESRHHR